MDKLLGSFIQVVGVWC